MRRFFSLDWFLIGAIGVLCSIGLLILYGLSLSSDGAAVTASGGDLASSLFVRQAVFVVIGGILLFLCASFDYDYLRFYSTAIYFCAIGLLLAIILFGTTLRGTTGWLDFGIALVQPVEIVKVLLVIFFAHFFAKKHNELGDRTAVIVSSVLIGIAIALVLAQPDLGSALVVSGMWLGMLALSAVKKSYLVIVMILGMIACGTSWFFLADYQQERLLTFAQLERDPQGAGYNVIQSMIAIGSGSVFGKGVGQGSQSQLHFLPERHTDFIYATIVEEIGLLGGILVLIALFVIFFRLYRTAQSARDLFGYYIVVGAMMIFFLQVTINVGMNIGVMPVTGIPLPFVSYGGSSLLSMFIMSGIVLSVYRRRTHILTEHVVESY